MKLIKYVKLPKEKVYKDEKGKQVTKKVRYSYYILCLENGQGVYLKPCFDVGYAQLDVLCEKVIFEKEKNTTPTTNDKESKSNEEDLPF